MLCSDVTGDGSLVPLLRPLFLYLLLFLFHVVVQLPLKVFSVLSGDHLRSIFIEGEIFLIVFIGEYPRLLVLLLLLPLLLLMMMIFC